MSVAVVRIVSRSNPLVARARRLGRDPAAPRRTGELLLEGEHLCAAWLARGRGAPRQALVVEAAWDDPSLRALASRASAVAVCSETAMAAASGLDSPPPIAFIVGVPEARAISPDAPAVVLDGVQDPGNVGAILRSAAAFGFAQVVALRGTAAPWSPKVVRAAMGAHFGLDLVEADGIDVLAALRVPLIGTSPHAAEPIDAAALPWPCAWAFGSEGRGLSAAVEARCALRVRIRQPGGEESLNVAAAAAICLHESARRRA